MNRQDLEAIAYATYFGSPGATGEKVEAEWNG